MKLEEFDETRVATIEPSEAESIVPNMPKIGITCFSKKLIDHYVEIFNGEKIAELANANGRIPVYKIHYQGHEFALFMSRVGAPACVISYEEMIAKGLDKLIMFGTCGVLDKNIEDLAIIIPTSAIRDEGTSYHYMKASDEVSVNDKYRADFIHILNHNQVTYVEGKTWTTDAAYRETRSKVQRRKQEDCICVDMECSAMSAVSKFRGKDLFQFFYAADNLDSATWDKRSLECDDRLAEKEKIIYLALDLAMKIAQE